MTQPPTPVSQRPILREQTHDGRVVGDPSPLALGVEVDIAVVPLIEQAL